jgi:hypothetical protein
MSERRARLADQHRCSLPDIRYGPSRHFAAMQQFGRFSREADIPRAALTKPNL